MEYIAAVLVYYMSLTGDIWWENCGCIAGNYGTVSGPAHVCLYCAAMCDPKTMQSTPMCISSVQPGVSTKQNHKCEYKQVIYGTHEKVINACEFLYEKLLQKCSIHPGTISYCITFVIQNNRIHLYLHISEIDSVLQNFCGLVYIAMNVKCDVFSWYM